MADLKISQLSSATALDGTEVVPVVQGGATKKATIDQILAPAAGKGIDFSANGGDVLTQYDEGTFTCGMTASSSGTITLNNSYKTGRYTRIGRQVTVCGFLVVDSVSSPVGAAFITGLPFTNGTADSNLSSGTVYATGMDATAVTALQARIAPSESRLEVALFAAGSVAAAAGKIVAGTQITFNVTYFLS